MNQDRTHGIENDEITIDVTELLSVLWSKARIIILVAILFAVAAFGGTRIFITPMYTSTTSMYMLTRSDTSSSLTTGDLQTGTQLTQDYMELVKSRSVLEEVISVLNLDMTADELESTITTSNAENTRIMSISVENEDPELAKEIADALREAASVKIQDIMEIDAVNTIDEASMPQEPSSPSVMRNTMLGGVLGAILAIGVIALIFILDDTIKTPDDVEYYLGLNVLTSIPLREGEPKVKKTRKRNMRQNTRKMRH